MIHAVEQARLPQAAAVIGAAANRYDDVLAALPGMSAAECGQWLWQRAVADAQNGHLDDRPLYWARLKALAAIEQRGGETAPAERRSRGFHFEFPPGEAGVLVTGFDPFRLDRHIGQCNPSGVAALALHGTRIGGAPVRAAILPVRFEDFDRGVVEALLTPYFRADAQAPLLLAVTLSMGRDHFDLERFPGRRRSAAAADNQNVQGGGSPDRPRAPPSLAGPEFLEFCLPAPAMTSAPGRWLVRDNRQVEVLGRGVVCAEGLGALAGGTAVAGSSGGFLSNELAYRSLLLRTRLGGAFPLGHLHTPAILGHDAALLADLVAQVRGIVAAAVYACEGRRLAGEAAHGR